MRDLSFTKIEYRVQKNRQIKNENTYEGPSSLILRLASQWPISMDSASDLPSTMPATNPPAKASLDQIR